MINTVVIDNIQGIYDIMSEQPYHEDIKRYRSTFVYRGVPDASYKLLTTLQRVCKDHKNSLEPKILENFAKYAELEDPSIKQSVWRQMILGQHHGLPTRLLDWTQSCMVALHFATTENNMDKMDKRDCAIWRIDLSELDDLLPDKYQAVRQQSGRDVFSVDMLNEACSGLDEYDWDMQNRAMLVLEPPSIDPRIVNQYSFFTITPGSVVDIAEFLDRNTANTVKYVIKKELRWQIRDMLDQFNTNERIIYPGLDGISAWLGRHYYVRDGIDGE